MDKITKRQLAAIVAASSREGKVADAAPSFNWGRVEAWILYDPATGDVLASEGFDTTLPRTFSS